MFLLFFNNIRSYKTDSHRYSKVIPDLLFVFLLTCFKSAPKRLFPCFVFFVQNATTLNPIHKHLPLLKDISKG